MNIYDVIVVGAGLSGAVMAERLASQGGKRVLVIEKREHVAGNCFDYRNEYGILVHKYGPHLFHTNKEHVWHYLSQFTQWTPYEHEVLASIDGKLVPLPFNLNTLDALYTPDQAQAIEALLIQEYGTGNKVPILALREHANSVLKQLADLVYDKFFVNYTVKQWGVAPEDISPEVTARVPIVISRDNRYFDDKYQAIPCAGYSKMVEAMLSHRNIAVRLNTDAAELIRLDHATSTVYFDEQKFTGQLVFTGMLDELFNFDRGELPYRSLQFDFRTIHSTQFQLATTVNYPNEHAYTRITEFKHILPCDSPYTTIVKEYPQDFDRHDPAKNVPYYPVFNKVNQQLYSEYQKRLDGFHNVISVGRLADYKYYNMDDAVGNALDVFVSLSEKIA
ncbi:MAG: UDP-galactopyranose mutase [Paraglaciecola polaris]|uniref:UDP-galactopyranose mutase n=1 Tax=Paraglaciecola polaris TaxID=222814 RepID=UPI00300326AF